MQTMVFDKNMMPLEEVSVNADKNSPSYAMALMVKQFPGSWLPYGNEQVIRNAAHHAVGVAGRMRHGSAEALELAKRLRQLERPRDAAAAHRRLEQAVRGMLPLQIVELRQARDAAAEGFVRRDVADACAAIPKSGWPLAQSQQHVGTAARAVSLSRCRERLRAHFGGAGAASAPATSSSSGSRSCGLKCPIRSRRSTVAKYSRAQRA